MHVGAVSVRFGLILEAYCRGSQEFLDSYAKQFECLTKLRIVSENVKLRKTKTAQAFQELACEEHLQETLLNVVSPLDPAFKWKRIK